MIRTRKIGAGGMHIKAVVYSPFGVGKTLFACSAGSHPEMGPALLVNIEGGGITASNLTGVEETEQLGQFSDVTEVFWNLANGSTDEGGHDWGQYNTVVLDSGSALQDMAVSEIAYANASAKKAASRVSQQDWGDSNRMVGELLRKFKSLPLNVIVTARQRDGYPDGWDDAKKAQVGPVVSTADFTPGLGRMVNHTFDHIWAMKMAEDGTRYLLTADNGVYRAKTRGPAFAEAMGEVVQLKNPTEPDSPGATLPDLFNLYHQTQGKNA